jgi:uncharacterized protein YecA (UPF0149 family)
MQREIYKYRHWCPDCNEWTVFEEKGKFAEEIKVCKVCGLEHQKVKLSTIPKEKVQEQRERYKTQQRNDFVDIYSSFMDGSFANRGNILYDLLTESPVEMKVRIVEADAGQRAIDDAEKVKRQQEQEKMLAERRQQREWKAQYKELGRNDKCICGSGKKYKKCCLSKVNSIK